MIFLYGCSAVSRGEEERLARFCPATTVALLLEHIEVAAVSVGRDAEVEATGSEEADAKESLPGGVGEGEGGRGECEEEAILTLMLS